MSPPARCWFCCWSFLIAVYPLLSMSAANGDSSSTSSSCNPSSFTLCANLGANPYPFWASETCAASPSYVLSNCTPYSTHAYWDSFSEAALGVVGSPAVVAVTANVGNTEFDYGLNLYEYRLPRRASIQISWNISLADSSNPCPPMFSAANLPLYNIPSSINLTRFPDSSALRFSPENVILLFNCTGHISDVAAQLGSTNYNDLIDDGSGCSSYKTLCNIQAETPCIEWSVDSSPEELMLQHVLDSLACPHFMLGVPSVTGEQGGDFTMFNPSVIELLWIDAQCVHCQDAGGHCTTDDSISFQKFSHCNCWNATSQNYSSRLDNFNTQKCTSDPDDGYCFGGPWDCMSFSGRIGIVLAAIVAVLGLCVLIRAGFPRFSKFSAPILLSIMKKIVKKLQAVSYRHRQWLDLLDLDGLTERPTEYSYGSIASATKSFNSFVGEGGFGRVYKGTLKQASSSNEQQIAVKVLDAKSKHSEKQFLNEVVTIGKIHHVNVVRLLGFCMQEDQAMLVYEYVVNGSLDKWLFEKRGTTQESHVLDWGQRYAIALGTARGLSYLHEECRHCTVHRDIKPQNILLDEDMRPKIADFGLARLMNREESKVVTFAKGTPGYMAPEFWMGGESQLSTKFDVYSYGMVLLELISGQRNFGGVAMGSSYGGSFPAMAFKVAMEGDLKSIVDARMEIRSDADDEQKQVQWQQIKTVVFVALWCIQDHPARRPHMSEVVKYLEGGAIISEAPPQPTIPISCASCPPQEFFLTSSSHPDNECTPLSGGR